MYFGLVSKVRSYLQNLGFPCEKDTGTAEYVLDCISRTNGGPEEQIQSDARLDRIAAAAQASTQNLIFGNDDAEDSVATYKQDTRKHRYRHALRFGNRRNLPSADIFRQFRLLLNRAFNETLRGKLAIFIKVVQQVTLGVVYGGIYKVGNNQASVMDRFGLLSLIAIGGLNMSIASTIHTFTREKLVVSSELASGMYRTLPYFLAKALSEIPLVGVYNALFAAIIYPLSNLQKGRFKQFVGMTTLHTLCGEALGLIIGAISPSTDSALTLLPAVIVLNLIFDGRNISAENTPKLLKWAQNVSLVRWGFEGLAVNEFNGLEFDTSGPKRGPVIKTGKEALDKFGFGDRKLIEVVMAQRNIIVGCWVLSFIGLSLSKTKYETMFPCSKSTIRKKY